MSDPSNLHLCNLSYLEVDIIVSHQVDLGCCEVDKPSIGVVSGVLRAPSNRYLCNLSYLEVDIIASHLVDRGCYKDDDAQHSFVRGIKLGFLASRKDTSDRRVLLRVGWDDSSYKMFTRAVGSFWKREGFKKLIFPAQIVKLGTYFRLS